MHTLKDLINLVKSYSFKTHSCVVFYNDEEDETEHLFETSPTCEQEK